MAGHGHGPAPKTSSNRSGGGAEIPLLFAAPIGVAALLSSVTTLVARLLGF